MSLKCTAGSGTSTSSTSLGGHAGLTQLYDCLSIASPTGLKCLKNGWCHTWTVPSTASVRKYNVKIVELYLEVDHVHAAAAHHHPVGDDRPPDLNILHHEPLEVVQDQFLGRICKQNVTKMSKIFTAPHSPAHPGNHRRRLCQSELRGKGVCTNWEWLDRDSVSEEFLFHCNIECCPSWQRMNIHIATTKSVDIMFKPLQQLHSVPVWSCVVVQSKKAPI